MNMKNVVAAVAATFLVNAYAQTNYEKIEVGTVVQGAIGIGTFVKPIPLPAGEWLLVSKRLDERALTTRGGDALKLTYVWMTLKSNKMDSSPVVAIVLSFTPDSSNINYSNVKCEAKDPKIVNDDFGTNPGSLTYLCARTMAWPPFKKFLSTAPESTNQWIKSNFTALSAFSEELPDNVVLRTVMGNKFRGRDISYTFVTKREGDFINDPAYAKFATDWTHADGQSLEKILNNSETSFAAPQPYVLLK